VHVHSVQHQNSHVIWSFLAMEDISLNPETINFV